MNGPYEYKERRELVELCLNCTRENCDGYCEEYCAKASRRGVRLYAAFGEQHTLTKWAQKYSLAVSTVYERMRDGMTLEQALTQKRESRRRKVMWRGEWVSLMELSKLTGVPYHRLADRLNAGWTVEDAVNKPRRNRGPKGENMDEQSACDQGGRS